MKQRVTYPKQEHSYSLQHVSTLEETCQKLTCTGSHEPVVPPSRPSMLWLVLCITFNHHLPLYVLLPFTTIAAISFLELSLIHLLPNALGTACLVLVRIFTHGNERILFFVGRSWEQG